MNNMIAGQMPPITPRFIRTIKLWDKLIPVAYVGHKDDPYIPLQVLCEMLNLEHAQELARMTSSGHLLSMGVSNIKAENWIDDEHLEVGDTVWIEISTVPMWLTGINPDMIQDLLAHNTLSILLLHIRAGIAEQFNLGSREQIMADHRNLMRDVADTTLKEK